MSWKARLHKGTAARPAVNGSLDEIMARYERELIDGLLEQNHYSLAKTAEQLKISRHALRYRMQRLNIATERRAGGGYSASAGKNDL